MMKENRNKRVIKKRSDSGGTRGGVDTYVKGGSSWRSVCVKMLLCDY